MLSLPLHLVDSADNISEIDSGIDLGKNMETFSNKKQLIKINSVNTGTGT
jgi:hypothetical protein